MPIAPIVVYSHLRWDSVFQRPHHVMSRLAATRRVLFVEEPVRIAGGSAYWEIQSPMRDLIVCRPHTDAQGAAFDQSRLPGLLPLAHALLRGSHSMPRHVAWLYTPMALPLARALDPELLVYDCMDELSAFLGAPAGLHRLESELLREAGVVFAGGPSLYEAKRTRTSNIHCVPSSVDAAHFRPARDSLPELPEVAGIPHPRLGFFGVRDERLDHELLRRVATAHPEWHLLLVGPVAKIDPACLPRLPNIHYFGQRPYEELPSHLASWDVCLLPFARNAATRMISPTKTLEYMAAEKPIVSTPIRDVAELYGDIVYLGADAATFIAACEQALAAPAGERAMRTDRMRAVLNRTSWSATVVRMARELERVALRRRLTAARTVRAGSAPVAASS
jgi:UDP-galactopyranose mutase